jgi:HlyD family secretion protein
MQILRRIFMRRLLILTAILVIIALISGAAYLGLQSGRGQNQPAAPPPLTVSVTRGDVVQSVVAPGQLESTQQAQLAMATTGTVARIDVRPGDQVRAGDTLAELDLVPLQKALDDAQRALERAQPEHARQLATAQLDLAIAQANLTKAQARTLSSATSEAVTIAQHRVEQAKNTLWGFQAQRDSACGRARDAACDAAQAAVQANEEAVRIAEVQLQTAQAQLQQDIEKARVDQAAAAQDLAVLQAQVERAQITLDRLKEGLDPTLLRNVEAAQAALEGATLKAPFDGTVIEVMAKVGETVGPNRGMILLANTAAVEVRATVTEGDLTLIEVGQAVELVFDAQPGLAVQGHVDRIVPQRIDAARALYPIYISLDEPAPGIVPGMTVDGFITIASRQDVLRLPRALVRAGAGGTARVQVWANGQIENRDVQTGLRGDVYVEIIEGLSEGEQVVSR